jgi:pyridoxine 4-dehydrogenase
VCVKADARVHRLLTFTLSISRITAMALGNLELQSLVNVARESNAAFFDTAERYGSHYKTALGMGWGETEQLTKKFLANTPVSSDQKGSTAAAVIATKFTPSPWRTTVASVVEACRQSCERLGVDQIDLYQLHMPDIVQPFRVFGQGKSKDEIYWQGLAECYRLGLVKNVGVCNYGPTLLAKCQSVLAQYNVPLASNQISYSLLGRHNGAQETVDYCNANGITVLAAFPFAMGLLTGKYSPVPVAGSPATIGPAADQLSLTKSQKTSLEERDLRRYATGDGGVSVPSGGMAPLLTVMDEIATARGKTVAQVALNYIMCQGAIPIPGARTTAQVTDNLGALGWRLTEAQVARLEAAADGLGFDFEGAGFKRTSEKFVGYGVEKWRLD